MVSLLEGKRAAKPGKNADVMLANWRQNSPKTPQKKSQHALALSLQINRLLVEAASTCNQFHAVRYRPQNPLYSIALQETPSYTVRYGLHESAFESKTESKTGIERGVYGKDAPAGRQHSEERQDRNT